MTLRSIFLIGFLMLGFYASSQRSHYIIRAALDTTSHEITASQTLIYLNNSGETLERIYFHLWANAYRSNNTELITQQLFLGKSDQYFFKPFERGGYSELKLTSSKGINFDLNYEDENEEVMYIDLPEKLEPDAEIVIEFEFKVKVPKLSSRFGRSEDYYQMVHWYPRAVKCEKGLWHAMPYLELGEYYHDFADYDVTLVKPLGFQIFGTGIKNKVTETDLFFKAENVTDFAWFASNHFTVEEKEIEIDDKEITLKVIKHHQADAWENAMDKLERSIRFLSEEIGEYPFPEAKVVLSASANGSGMEYPMITIIGNHTDAEVVDHLIVHEIAHNWFYGSLSTNERRYPWLDEGLTTFYDHKYHQRYYQADPYQSMLPEVFNTKSGISVLQSSVHELMALSKMKESDLHSEEYSAVEYGVSVYERPAMAFRFLENYLGASVFKESIQHYYKENKFSNPDVNDLKNSFELISKKNLDWFFDQYIASNTGPDYEIKQQSGNSIKVINHSDIEAPLAIKYHSKGEEVVTWIDGFQGEQDIVLEDNDSRVSIPIDLNILDHNPWNNADRKLKLKFLSGMDNPEKKQVFFLPYAGFNAHDHLFIGASFYNSSFPAKRFKWMVAPGISITGTEPGLVGLASMQYDFARGGDTFRKVIGGVQAKRFNRFSTDSYALHYEKIKPFLRFYFDESEQKRITKYLELNGHFIFEENAIFQEEEILFEKKFRVAEQLKYMYWFQDPIASIKWETDLELQQYSKFDNSNASYVKLTSAYTYKYQFAKNKHLKFRLFGSYFLQNSERESSAFASSLARGSIALTPQGFNDHLYEDFYFGRNLQSGFLSQQIGQQGGGFKNALTSSYKTGLSNNFGFAANFIIDTPLFFSPFLDVGYYAAKTSTEAEFQNKTLFSIGLALELFDDSLGIYIPFFNSSEVSDIYKTQSFASRISFRIDLNRLDFWKATEDYNF